MSTDLPQTTTTTTSRARPAPTQSTTIAAGGGATGERSFSHRGWHITSVVLPILNGPDSDKATIELEQLPLPEICFGHNRLTIESKATGLKLQWDTLQALHAVKRGKGASDLVKVAHAAEWASRQNNHQADLTVQRPFDWTYTTLHPGTTTTTTLSSSSSSSSSSTSTSFQPAPQNHPGIPLHFLARQDVPILFFSECPLFEDELGDNGVAELVVRIRVNESSFFVLSRFFLRVDGVLLRTFDVRVYHEFGTLEIVRESKGRQSTYDDVKRRLPRGNPDDLKPLTDVNWVSTVLESLASSSTATTAETTIVKDKLRDLNLRDPSSSSHTSTEQSGSRAGGSSLPEWEGLGRKLEVLYLQSKTTP